MSQLAGLVIQFSKYTSVGSHFCRHGSFGGLSFPEQSSKTPNMKCETQ